MANISDRQKRFLDEIATSSLNRLAYNLDRLTQIGEPLDVKWVEVWDNNVEKFREIYPKEIFLRVEKNIPKNPPIDFEITKIKVKADEEVCFLLGAGASVAEPSNIPTVANLLPELWLRAGKLGRDEIDKLAEWCDKHGVTNIEDLLTAAYISNFSAKNGNVTQLLDYFLFKGDADNDERGEYYARKRSLKVDSASISSLQDTLQVLFALLTGRMIPAKPNAGHEAIVKFLKNRSGVSIVTTNYDGCIDEALLSKKVNVNTYIDEEKIENSSSTPLIKIHGSINWTYCDSCHDVREFDLLKQKEAFGSDTFSYAVIGICRKCGGQRRPLLIPPIGLKFIMFPSLIRLWNEAREKIEKSKYIITVGYSFSDADTYINKIVERSMSVNNKQKLIICDPNQKLVDSLRKKYSARIELFDSKRILKVVGSSDKILPELLEMISKEEKLLKGTKKKSATKIRKKQISKGKK